WCALPGLESGRVLVCVLAALEEHVPLSPVVPALTRLLLRVLGVETTLHTLSRTVLDLHFRPRAFRLALDVGFLVRHRLAAFGQGLSPGFLAVLAQLVVTHPVPGLTDSSEQRLQPFTGDLG